MDNFTFLTAEQVFGNGQLEIFKKYGAKCAITDFSILLGGAVASYSSDDTLKKDRNGWWWTKSSDGDNDALIVNESGSISWFDVYSRHGGARPALPYSSISFNNLNVVIGSNGILEVEYGEYPQTVVSEDFSRILESAYSNKTLNQTGRVYTTNSVQGYDDDNFFKEIRHIEYEYNGKRYIRFIGDSNGNGKMLSDGRIVGVGEIYWIEVEPIKWLVDVKEDIALSKKIIFSGVSFNKQRNYQGDFDKTDIKEFMDKYFGKDVTPSCSKGSSLEETDQLVKNKILIKN